MRAEHGVLGERAFGGKDELVAGGTIAELDRRLEGYEPGPRYVRYHLRVYGESGGETIARAETLEGLRRAMRRKAGLR
jgi:repressor of nif and glnA expression